MTGKASFSVIFHHKEIVLAAAGLSIRDALINPLNVMASQIAILTEAVVLTSGHIDGFSDRFGNARPKGDAMFNSLSNRFDIGCWNENSAMNFEVVELQCEQGRPHMLQ